MVENLVLIGRHVGPHGIRRPIGNRPLRVFMPFGGGAIPTGWHLRPSGTCPSDVSMGPTNALAWDFPLGDMSSSRKGRAATRRQAEACPTLKSQVIQSDSRR